MRVREPQVAGSFYPADRGELVRVIEECFLDKKFGPGRLPGPPGSSGVAPVAGVAPHAGYSYSGPCAAHLYLVLGESGFRPDTVVVIGTNHTGYGGVFTTTSYFDAWETPLGLVPVDVEMVELLKKLDGDLVDNVSAHLGEHSVEVQLPFLQYVYGAGFRLVPIVAMEASRGMAARLASAIVGAAEKLGRRVLVIASSDFTHHGPWYGYVVFTENVAENVRKLDLSIIEEILRLDTEGFLRRVAETGATVCGVGAIAATIEYVRIVGGSARLLKYYNSGEKTGDETAVVGYASILFHQ